MNGLFGLELPTSVNFVIAFVVVLALIGAATWLVRRFGAPRLDAAARNRQPRLAVIDSAAVDGRRKLVIIRRDNVEHLLMIGGPSDVVVETNIVRAAAAAARETPAVRANGGETLPRAMPLPDTQHWPLQPEPVAPAARSSGPRPVEPPRAGARPRTCSSRSRSTRSRRSSRQPPSRRSLRRPRPFGPCRRRHRALRLPRRRSPRWCRSTQPFAAANDQNLANMAHQLEAALRRPVAGPAEAPKAAEPKRVEPVLRPVPKAAPAAAAPAVAPQTKPVHSIEQEMASLLGRPGKT